METYFVDPASAALHSWTALAIGLATGIAGAILVGALGRKAWWLLGLAAVVLPSAIVIALGAGLPSHNWTVAEFMTDVMLPLALIGVPGALAGAGLGALTRRGLRRNR